MEVVGFISFQCTTSHKMEAIVSGCPDWQDTNKWREGGREVMSHDMR